MPLLDQYTADAFDLDRLTFAPAQRSPSYFGEIFGAAWESFGNQYLFQADRRMKLDFMAQDMELYEEITGNRFQSQIGIQLNPFGPDLTDQLLDDFFRQINELPPEQQSQFNLDYDNRVAEVFQEDAQRYRETAAAAARPFTAGAATFIGGLAVTITDPLVLATSAVGYVGLARLGATFAQGVASEVLFNIGVEAATQPSVFRQTELAGEAYTWHDAVANVIFAGIIGGAFYGGARGAGALFNSLRRAQGSVPESGLQGAQLRQVIDELNLRIDEGIQGPVQFGTRTDAASYFRGIDDATMSVIEGRMIEPTRVDVTSIDIDPVIRTVGRNTDVLSEVIENTELRAAARANAEQVQTSFREELAALDKSVRDRLNAPELIAAERRAEVALGSIEQLEAARAAIGRGEVPPIDTLALLAPDRLSAARLTNIERDLEEPGLSAAERADLEQEQAQVYESIREDVARELDQQLTTARREAQAARSDLGELADRLRALPEYRASLRRDQAELASKLASTAARVDSGQPLPFNPSTTYDPTPWRASVWQRTQEQVDAVAPERVPSAPEGEMAGTASELIKERLGEGVDKQIGLRDPITGDTRTVPVKELLDELDEDAAAIAEFRACRGITNG